MIDFKKKLEESQMKSGRCLLSDQHYASVKGKLYHFPLTNPSVIDVHFRINQDSDRFVIQFLNGVTGYEAFNIDDLLADPCYDYWSICGGCHKYDRLDIDGAQLMEFLEHFDKVIRPSLMEAK